MSMFSLNAGDSQSMGRRIFRRPYLFMRHRARRMEHRIARVVSAGGISGGVAGAVAGMPGCLLANGLKEKIPFLKKIGAIPLPALEIVQAQRWVLFRYEK